MSQPSAPSAGPWPPPQPPQGWQHPAPAPPKPERPLKPAVWWGVGLNVGWVVGWFAFLFVVGLFLLYGSEAFSQRRSGGLIATMIGGAAINLIIGIGLTVVALLLLRRGRAYRTFPSFLQALLAALCALVVTGVLGLVVRFVLGLTAVTPGF